MKNTNSSKFEGAIRRIGWLMLHRDYDLARHHLNRVLKHYDELTLIEQDVVTEQRLQLYCTYTFRCPKPAYVPPLPPLPPIAE